MTLAAPLRIATPDLVPKKLLRDNAARFYKRT
jgi:hypothetical protein